MEVLFWIEENYIYAWLSFDYSVPFQKWLFWIFSHLQNQSQSFRMSWRTEVVLYFLWTQHYSNLLYDLNQPRWSSLSRFRQLHHHCEHYHKLNRIESSVWLSESPAFGGPGSCPWHLTCQRSSYSSDTDACTAGSHTSFHSSSTVVLLFCEIAQYHDAFRKSSRIALW